MKTTTFRNLANPRRTTLTHLEDARTLQLPTPRAQTAALPDVTANPRRTVRA
ncbi:hypothetical protein ACIG8K_02050 [Streptomyces halstedii]|uniref:hypothetical protein n=1 Tax=Streptomyces halstedii TaxID=1944 RepID=UPI00324A185F